MIGLGLSIYELSKLDHEKCINKPIVESVTPLFSFEGRTFVSRYLLELPKKEEMQSFVVRQNRRVI